MKFIFRDGPHLDDVSGLGTRTIAREKRVSRHSLAFVADCYQKSDELDAKLVIIHRFFKARDFSDRCRGNGVCMVTPNEAGTDGAHGSPLEGQT
jgi:hypothetical protein